jgi:hypothetical protein
VYQADTLTLLDAGCLDTRGPPPRHQDMT